MKHLNFTVILVQSLVVVKVNDASQVLVNVHNMQGSHFTLKSVIGEHYRAIELGKLPIFNRN